MRSDPLIRLHKEHLADVMNAGHTDNISFLRRYLFLLNGFLFERLPPEQIEKLNLPNTSHPEWERITTFLAIWDDYHKEVIGYPQNEQQIKKLASIVVKIFQGNPQMTSTPRHLDSDAASESLAGLSPRQFALIRLMHALQDFSQTLPAIDSRLVNRIREGMDGIIPDEDALCNESNARNLLHAFGGADSNVDERIRYIFSSARIIRSWNCDDVYGLIDLHGGDARKIYDSLTQLPGLKTKKANMILRDYYELGIWSYTEGLDSINIIADNRIMRIALRTGIISPSLEKLLNSLLDIFDFQYGLTVQMTEEAFRAVWEASSEFNGGMPIVSYPARLDELMFRLGDPRSGCCKPRSLSCRNQKKPPTFYRWLNENFKYNEETFCPLQEVCKEDCKDYLAPYAIQNNTWMGIFSGSKGGGGLRGI